MKRRKVILDDLLSLEHLQMLQDSFCPDCPHNRLLDEKGQPAKPANWEVFVPARNIWAQMTIQAIYWVDGRLAQMVTLSDITGIKRMQKQLARLAYYDRSMHLPNALKLLKDLAERESGDHFHLICFGILALRNINDVYSRQAGDMLLSEIVRWLAGLGVKESRLYRLGGDQFGLLVRDCTREDAYTLTQWIASRFDEAWTFRLGGEKISIFCGVSIGIVYGAHSFDAADDDLIGLIERTLSHSRRDRKITVYDEHMDQQFRDKLRMELSLRNCVKNGMEGFAVQYQPIVSPSTGMWTSLEALCRWTSLEFGAASPLVFIHIAEQLGLIGAIGNWVLETSVRQCKAWSLGSRPGFILYVNISPTQLTDERLVSAVADILERYGYPGDKLSLEITESAELNFSNHTLKAIDKLRAMGIKIALDDFGTGYASFNNLKKLPASILKTERAFLNDIENDDYLQFLLHVMAELAHAARMKLIAEGVENEAQLQLLLKNGVDYLQGYLFSRPLDARELEKQLYNFYKVSSLFLARKNDFIDIPGILDSSYTIAPGLYKLLNQCMRILLAPVSAHSPVNRALRLVGERFHVSRAVVYWLDENGTFHIRSEWSAPDAPVRVHTTEKISRDALVSLIEPNKAVIVKDISTLDKALCQLLHKQGIKFLVCVPLWKDDALVGLVGFDDCRSFRNWSAAEVLLLHNLSLLIENVYEKRALGDQAEHL